jgi:hypothetical protein
MFRSLARHIHLTPAWGWRRGSNVRPFVFFFRFLQRLKALRTLTIHLEILRQINFIFYFFALSTPHDSTSFLFFPRNVYAPSDFQFDRVLSDINYYAFPLALFLKSCILILIIQSTMKILVFFKDSHKFFSLFFMHNVGTFYRVSLISDKTPSLKYNIILQCFSVLCV